MKEHDKDIENYIQHTLYIGDGQSSKQVRADLLCKASGVFMWVVLAVPILNKAFDAGGKHTLQHRLRQIPGDLHDLFRDMLTRDEHDRSELLSCIQWVLFAKEPLTPRRLYFAIISAVDPGSLTQCHSDEITDDDVKRFVLDKSKGLTELNTSLKIQFIHESVRDFLLKYNGLTEIWPDSLVNIEGQSHEVLKQACLAYISSDPVSLLRFPHPLPDASSPRGGDIILQLYHETPFLKYAVSNIMLHANEAKTKGFRQTQFLGTFPFDRWVTYHNLYQDYSGHQFSPASSGRSCFEPESEAFLTPIFAALACECLDAVEALFEQQLSMRTADSSLPNLPPLEVSDYRPVMRYYNGLSADDYSFDVYTPTGVVYYMVEAGDEISLAVYRATEQYDFKSLARSGFFLSFAAERGHNNMVKFLIEHGADISALDPVGWTPLLIALNLGHVDVAMTLIENGADVNTTNRGRSPLAVAISKEYHGVVALLIQRGAQRGSILLPDSDRKKKSPAWEPTTFPGP
ncbi:hypothetical protein PG997_005336 [Apiospora hydei]|uniref:Ankyrin repeat protein n=1 Tax=Apiospora hydei TaxID=1337664 RepID=A0ABR1X4M5_9PEZI